MPAFPNPIHLSHQFIRQQVKPGDTVIDATLGNGHDSLFLAKLVGEKGKVIGFDVQDQAISESTKRMENAGVNWFTFHHAGHETMENKVEGSASVIMFNLGYLPSADKSVITQLDTTIQALNQSLTLLQQGGLLSIMCYPGHSGGDTESAEVEQWSKSLERTYFRVANYQLLNSPNNPPFLVLVEKL